MQKDKKHISDLVHHCAYYGMEYLVISPGSRNGPMIRAFATSKKIKCVSVVDERSAGFVALGMAMQLQAPVGVVCTSGSAPLNYSPAIAEAYYQNIPLIVLTADRPATLIDQQDSQTIRQRDIYKNIIKHSVCLPEEPVADGGLLTSAKLVAESFTHALKGKKGPVHINVPLADPLYENKLFEQIIPSLEIVDDLLAPFVFSKELIDNWNEAGKKMIVCGQETGELEELLKHFADDNSVVVVAENLANIVSEFYNLDAHILSGEVARDKLAPDMLISFGGHVVSKHLKLLLREFPETIHYRLDPDELGIDTYQNLDSELPIDEVTFFKEFIDAVDLQGKDGSCDYQKIWQDALAGIIEPEDKEYQVLKTLLGALPAESIVHLGNSMTVRHSQKIPTRYDIQYHGNRGVAGIDGSLSTAVGTAMVTVQLVLCVLGDLSFIYDSNGLWNNKLPDNLRVVVLNNSGGDIFNRIKGPSTSEGFEEFFIAHHPVDIGLLVQAYGARYIKCQADNISEVQVDFLSNDKGATVLEIII